ncbi:MAG: FtsX-like permease family protein [Steroidobacteraceae bacterium]
MELRPILSAMRRNKLGAALIGMQMALTLAILANGLTLIEQRMKWSDRPTGIDEQDIFVMTSESLDHVQDPAARQGADVAALRSLSGVVDAYATNDYPLKKGGWSLSVNLTRDQKIPTADTAYYFVDEHALHTLGLKLIAGRNFTAEEIADRSATSVPPASGLIVTQALAKKLFPAGNALGQPIYAESDTVSTPIIGIVAQLQTPFAPAAGYYETFAENSVLAPYRLLGDANVYIVRARPAQIDAVMRAAERRLFEIDGDRMLHSLSMAQARADAYRDAHGFAVLLGTVCSALLAVTAFGIVGLTSYWVTRRRRQIGIRRALGATRSAIFGYFQTENFLIAGAAALVGLACAVGLNLWLVSSFEMVRLQLGFAIVGAALMLLLGQAAAFWPALRAAAISPALATRGG